ncbi:hypothetical protein [Halalkalibacter lacteus]|uniref:hypothetical protein n=1 Tax=Halalkalibacter lacteus TaxID=3090663 RepID=UPI002FC743FC
MKKQLTLFLSVFTILLFYPSQGLAANECSESSSIFKDLNSEDSHWFSKLINAERNNKVTKKDLMVTDQEVSLSICEFYVNDNTLSYSFKVTFDEELIEPNFFRHSILNKPVISVNGEWVNHSDVIWSDKVSENEYIGVQVVDVHTKEIDQNDTFEVIYQQNVGLQGIWGFEISNQEEEKEEIYEIEIYKEKLERADRIIPFLPVYERLGMSKYFFITSY